MCISSIFSSLNDLSTSTAILTSAAIGAVAGYWSSHRVIKKQQKREKELIEEKKLLVEKLLKDEINFRWKEKIGKTFQNHANDKNLKAYSVIHFSEKDLFVTYKVGHSFTDYYFLHNDLISHIVYAGTLVRDLIDLQKRVSKRNANEDLLLSRLDYYLSEINKTYDYILSEIG